MSATFEVGRLVFLVVGVRDGHARRAGRTRSCRPASDRRSSCTSQPAPGVAQSGLLVAQGAEQREARSVLVHMSSAAERRCRAIVPNFDHSGLTLRTELLRPTRSCQHASESAASSSLWRSFVPRLRTQPRLREHAGAASSASRAALDARQVDEAAPRSRSARRPGRRASGNGLAAALGDRPRAVAHALAALDGCDHRGWVLKRWNSSKGDSHGFL